MTDDPMPTASPATAVRQPYSVQTPYTWPDNAAPTDEELAEWLRVCTPEERVERVHYWREQTAKAFACEFTERHAARIAECERYRRLGQVVPGV